MAGKNLGVVVASGDRSSDAITNNGLGEAWAGKFNHGGSP
jgi:hypothetical protein